MIRVPAGLETDFDHTEFCCYEISKLINRIFYRKSDLLGVIFYTRNVNIFKSFNPNVILAPSFCGDNCFRVIRDLSDCISFP